MDSIMPGAITLVCAGCAVIVVTITRRLMRPPKRHRFAQIVTACVFAVLLAAAFAASMFYLGQSEKVLIASFTAFVATCTIHVGLAALFIYLVPIEPSPFASREYRNEVRRPDGMAA